MKAHNNTLAKMANFNFYYDLRLPNAVIDHSTSLLIRHDYKLVPIFQFGFSAMVNNENESFPVSPLVFSNYGTTILNLFPEINYTEDANQLSVVSMLNGKYKSLFAKISFTIFSTGGTVGNGGITFNEDNSPVVLGDIYTKFIPLTVSGDLSQALLFDVEDFGPDGQSLLVVEVSKICIVFDPVEIPENPYKRNLYCSSSNLGQRIAIIEQPPE